MRLLNATPSPEGFALGDRSSLELYTVDCCSEKQTDSTRISDANSGLGVSKQTPSGWLDSALATVSYTFFL